MTTQELKEYVEANGTVKLLEKFGPGKVEGFIDDDPTLSTCLYDLQEAYVAFKGEEAYFLEQLEKAT